MSRRRDFSIVCLIGMFLSMALPTVNAQTLSQMSPPKVIRQDHAVRIELAMEAEKPVSIFYKTPDMTEYQCRAMVDSSEQNWSCQIETDTLFGQQIEYYIQTGENAASRPSPLFYIDLSESQPVPEVAMQQDPPPQQPPPLPASSPWLRIGATLAGDFLLKRGGSGESQVINDVDINGNIRLYRNITDGKTQIDLDATLSYMKNPSPLDNNINLQTMVIRFKDDHHLFEMGDMSINFSEYSASYLSRRGLQYTFTSNTFSLGGFWVNAQQKTGFNGLGFPPTQGMILGAKAGFNLSQRLIVQGIFMSGKDDQSSKTLYSSDNAYREGQLISLLGTLHVLPGHWSLDGEYASSNYGQAPSADNLQKNTDTAWKAGTSASYGPVSGRFQYQQLGQHFNSIANMFLQNDREGLLSNLTVSQGSFSLNLTYQDQKTFIHHPLQPSQRSKNLGTQLNWLIANHFSLGGEFALDNLEYDASTGLQTGGEGMKTFRAAASVGYVAGANSITFRAGKTESQTFTSNIDASVALSLRFGTFFSISPTVSYQRTTNLSDDSNSDILSLFTSGEISFVPQVASITFTGSFSQSKNPFADSETLSLGANANLFMAKFFKHKVQPTLSLRSQYQRGLYNGLSTDTWTLFLHTDLSF